MLEQNSGRGIRRKNQVLEAFLRRNHRIDRGPKVATLPVWRATRMRKADCDRVTTHYLKNEEKPHKVNSLFQKEKLEKLTDCRQCDRIDTERPSRLKQSNAGFNLVESGFLFAVVTLKLV